MLHGTSRGVDQKPISYQRHRFGHWQNWGILLRGLDGRLCRLHILGTLSVEISSEKEVIVFSTHGRRSDVFASVTMQ